MIKEYKIFGALTLDSAAKPLIVTEHRENALKYWRSLKAGGYEKMRIEWGNEKFIDNVLGAPLPHWLLSSKEPLQGYGYLASPYSHSDPRVMESRFFAAMHASAALMRKGYMIFSPIIHCHEMAQEHELPTTFAFWESYNRVMLARANKLLVLALPGWEESTGVLGERRTASERGIPSFLVTLPWLCKDFNEMLILVKGNYDFKVEALEVLK